MYNNERVPLILIYCGHTYCKGCLDLIINEKNEISCPECKQITIVAETPSKSLPKNRGLLDLIIYNEQITKSTQELKIESPSTDNKESIIILTEFEKVIKKLEETYSKLIDEHSFLIDISDTLVIKEVDIVMDSIIEIINEYREHLHKKVKLEFEKVNLLKTFKYSITNYKSKIQEYWEILKNSDSVPSQDKINNDKFESQKGRNYLTSKETEYIKNEKEFLELYNLTLKQYSKEIYNPCKYFFLNKFQYEKLQEDIKKNLRKVCIFDERVYKYNFDCLNLADDKKIMKEIQDCCSQSNFKKLKFMFTHLRINPNFLFSELMDNITSQTNFTDNLNNVNINIPTNITHSNSSNHVVNLAGSNNTRVINQNNNASQIVSRPQRNQSTNLLSNLIGKDKIINLYSFLKNCKEKADLPEMIKFLIEECNYLPIKFETDTLPEIKFGREFEWKLNLNLL